MTTREILLERSLAALLAQIGDSIPCCPQPESLRRVIAEAKKVIASGPTRSREKALEEALREALEVMSWGTIGTRDMDDPDWYAALDKAKEAATAALASAPPEAPIDARVQRMADHCCVPELDEPFFVLLGRDPQAPGLVERWAYDRKAAEPDSVDKWRSAAETACDMRNWKMKHLERGMSMEAFARIALPEAPGGTVEDEIAALEKTLLDCADTRSAEDHNARVKARIAALRTAQAGPAGEPVAWKYRHVDYVIWSYTDDKAHVERLSQREGVQIEPLYTSPPAGDAREALADIAAERQRQISSEGWTVDHDDKHTDRSIARAASAYAAEAGGYDGKKLWPREWFFAWWKPKDNRRNLVKAGALIVAEIERLDRAALTAGSGKQ